MVANSVEILHLIWIMENCAPFMASIREVLSMYLSCKRSHSIIFTDIVSYFWMIILTFDTGNYHQVVLRLPLASRWHQQQRQNPNLKLPLYTPPPGESLRKVWKKYQSDSCRNIWQNVVYIYIYFPSFGWLVGMLVPLTLALSTTPSRPGSGSSGIVFQTPVNAPLMIGIQWISLRNFDSSNIISNHGRSSATSIRMRS